MHCISSIQMSRATLNAAPPCHFLWTDTPRSPANSVYSIRGVIRLGLLLGGWRSLVVFGLGRRGERLCSGKLGLLEVQRMCACKASAETILFLNLANRLDRNKVATHVEDARTRIPFINQQIKQDFGRIGMAEAGSQRMVVFDPCNVALRVDVVQVAGVPE